MKQVSASKMKKVLITGIDSFTGKHLSFHLEKSGYEVYGTSLFQRGTKQYKCDITIKDDILATLQKVQPNYLIHLAGISFAAHSNNEDFYRVNTIGTTNILDAILESDINLQKIILASSATVYGNQGKEVLDESLCPMPANHYGASKYAMECISKNYFDKLSLIITRPFNYTGVGQADNFLIPKIVKHFRENKKVIELGNLDVSREFNDIGFVCEVYNKLIESDVTSEIVNIASNTGYRLLDIVKTMQDIAGYEIDIHINQAFVRQNEIKALTGSSKKLFNIIGHINQKSIKETLKDIYND